jgi:hypothetical protein
VEQRYQRANKQMPAETERQPAAEPDQLEVATNQAIAACGGNAAML